MSSLEVRFARPDEQAVAHRLLTAQLVEHALPADAAGIDTALALLFQVGSPGQLAFALRDGVHVGACLTNRNVSVERGGLAIWIEELYVVPAARRSGVATALLKFLAEEGRKGGARSFELEVVPTQAAAFALYENLGFGHLDRQRLSLSL